MGVFRRFKNMIRRSKIDRDIDAEIQSHITLRTDQNIAAGMSAQEARLDALLRFGNPTSTREQVVAADATLSLEGLGRDIRYAFRQLGRSPGFALTAIVTLALGIGANVVVFGVLNAIILRPLNLTVAGRLFEVVQRRSGDDNQSYPDFVDYRTRNTTFSDMAAYRIGQAGLSAGGSAQEAWEFEVTGNYFDVLGVKPEIGRFFHTSDEHGPDSAPYVVLSDSFWRSRFNADPHVIGTAVDLNKHPFTIIGVAPLTFHGTELFFWPEFWTPMVNEVQIEGYNFLNSRTNHGLFVLGVLKPGVTPRQATDDLNNVASQLAREYPASDDRMGARLTKPGLGGDTLSGPMRAFLGGVMVLAILVLLAACTNLAGVFAARSADRTRELAIRLSIGSTRWRILRQLLTEAVLVSVLAGMAGTMMAVLLMRTLSRWQPLAEFPVRVSVVPDAGVFAIALLLSLASGILPGLLTARQVWLADPMQAIKSGSLTPRLLHRLRFRDLLLGTQIMLCALLVITSLVALRGMTRALRAPLGFRPRGVVLAEADLRMAGYSNDSALLLQRRMINDASRIPGVTAAGTINVTPLKGMCDISAVYHEGTTDMRISNSAMTACSFSISPGFLKAAETRLLAGRDFTWDDNAKSPKVAIINQTFARSMFGNSPAVGSHFLERDKTLYQIVGVVEDGKYQTLTEDPTAAIFVPNAQNADLETTLVVRSQLPSSDVVPALNRALTSIDSSQPFTIRSWPDSLALVLFPARVATATLGVMGLLAVMLAISGIFGMAAYTVSKRLRELGIRVALGAHRGQLMRAALGRPLIVLISGSVAGLVLGVLASRLLANLVYGATPRDPLVLVGALLAMTLIGLIAIWIPARRALGVNPAQLLRDE